MKDKLLKNLLNFFSFAFLNRALCSPGYPRTSSTDQADLPSAEIKGVGITILQDSLQLKKITKLNSLKETHLHPQKQLLTTYCTTFY